MRLFFINIFLFSSFFLPKAFGQMTESAIKSNFIINMAKFVNWENEDTIKRYNIGVLGGDEIFEELKNRAREIPLKDKGFDVIQVKKINEISDVHILYVDKRSNNAFRKVYEIAMSEKILMFSDSCLNRDIIMINLLDLDMPGSQFEINNSNMDKADFQVSPKLLYYGGSEDDLRGLYQASEQELSNVQGELEQQSAALKKQREELEIKKREILALNDEISLQEGHLKSMTLEVEARQDSLDQKIALLEAQKLKIGKQQTDIEKQNENIKSSIHYALTIQQALLPSKEEMEKFFEPFVVYRPRDIVSGDFYWMSEVVDERGEIKKIFIAVADCTGHGVPGAFLSMIGIKLLNSIVNERKHYDPSVILETLNSDIQEALKQEKKVSDDGMDICLCRLELTDENKIGVVYSGARRPLYYSYNHEQKIKILPGDRKTIGGRFYTNQVFTNKELVLNPGDRIYLSTDGIIDQNAPNRQKFGSKKLIKLLGDSLHLPMAEQKGVLENALDAFQQNERQRDDISLIGIKF